MGQISLFDFIVRFEIRHPDLGGLFAYHLYPAQEDNPVKVTEQCSHFRIKKEKA